MRVGGWNLAALLPLAPGPRLAYIFVVLLGAVFEDDIMNSFIH